MVSLPFVSEAYSQRVKISGYIIWVVRFLFLHNAKLAKKFVIIKLTKLFLQNLEYYDYARKIFPRNAWE